MSSNTKRISFFRQYTSYTGGHQKVRDYIDHFIALGWQVSLYVEGQSRIQPELFGNIDGVEYPPSYDPSTADVVFLAGMDWQAYLPLKLNLPVINLVQHVRHGNPNHPLFAFLPQPALRLCVSDAVKQAVLPYSNGQCQVITMGHDIPDLQLEKSNELYILATKQPELGNALKNWAQQAGIKVICHDRTVDKLQVLNTMATSSITLTLPHTTEGFYLPGIEATKLSDIAIVPHCVASKEYTHAFSNTLCCELEQGSIINAIERARRLLSSKLIHLRKWRGRRVVSGYSPLAERKQLAKVLANFNA